MIGRLVRLPLSLAKAISQVVTNNPDAFKSSPDKMRISNSVSGMTPGSPFITALATLPVAPGVAVHSIIAVKGDGPAESSDDGVVEYTSAHLSDATSELVVRSGRSNQSDPQTIAEVRRILLLHLKEACASGVGCANGTPAASVGPGRWMRAPRLPAFWRRKSIHFVETHLRLLHRYAHPSCGAHSVRRPGSRGNYPRSRLHRKRA